MKTKSMGPSHHISYGAYAKQWVLNRDDMRTELHNHFDEIIEYLGLPADSESITIYINAARKED